MAAAPLVGSASKLRHGPPAQTLAAVLCMLALTTSAAAGQSEAFATAEEPVPAATRQQRRPAAIAAAVVPGLLVHGAGHFVACERKTATKLLLMEGVGLGLAVAGGVPLVMSGASRYVAAPGTVLFVSGLGMAAISWAADLYGAAGGNRIGGRPRLSLPRIEAELGYAYVHDVQFDYTSFTVAGAHLRWQKWRVSPAVWMALDDDHQRWRGEVAYRAFGPRDSPRFARDGGYLEVVGAASHHRLAGEAFSVTSGELSTSARRDLAGLGPSLAGTFANLGLGLQVERVAYSNLDADLAIQLLMRVGFGIYLGGPGHHHGEVEVYYDHRRDELAGGYGVSHTAGWIGHVGVGGSFSPDGNWGLTGMLELGSAAVIHLGVRRSFGRPNHHRRLQ